MSKTLIHHITHMNNLPGILSEGGILCDQAAERKGLCKQSIGYADIKNRRARRPVEEIFGGRIAAEARVRQVFEKTCPPVDVPLRIKPDWYY